MTAADGAGPWRLAANRVVLDLAPGFVTRYAPAPTGFLHLGHVLNAIWVWGLARTRGGRVLLRVEDHDRMRCRPEYEAALREDLEWLGFVPDEPTVRQSDRDEIYTEALGLLAARRLVYPCVCTRREIAASSPPGGDELRYAGACRDRQIDPATTLLRRVRLESEEIVFDDRLLGRQRQVPSAQCGDLLARDRDGCWTYQFAVTVDDWDQKVDLVIRGQDLLASTGRQIQLARLLGREEPPRYLHHPLILRPDGSKLSKASGGEGVRDLRAAEWSPERVLGAAARAGGLVSGDRPLAQSELAGLF